MAETKLLFVDDEPDLLSFYRQVFERDFAVTVFSNAQAALDHLLEDSEYAVIVSDFSMPGMDGIEFLAAAREVAPHAVRIMLTGFASDETAISAVNRGDIFKFLRKPTRIAEFSSAMRAAVQRHELEAAERDLLEKTLRGSIEMMTEALSLASPIIFGRSTGLKTDMAQLARHLRVGPIWEMEAAAMLCELGLLTQSSAVMENIVYHQPTTTVEDNPWHSQAGIAADLVRKVPRLERVADSIHFQYRNYDGTGYPDDTPLAGDDIPIGARMLHILKDLRSSVDAGVERNRVIASMRGQPGRYDPQILDVLAATNTPPQAPEIRAVSVFSIETGDILAQDIESRDGTLIMRQGQEISPYLAQKLHHFADADEIDLEVSLYDSQQSGILHTVPAVADTPAQTEKSDG
ncbi:HD domain-containing phosphohydrolase [Chromatocurvus halotolerans]|uniref:Response regulator RpfG family c-di-GMP phosphodiesterase n=1 Tax=Chromatocurvus halotolerans TaxID=1132028 RepID=A0A4R2L3G4_9GAMM|nr:HD domain-containing phosphohydrolase [Chromatocurvus halotolerans]TCO78346.1 response regulator RpfG family c-di-GMP phosphodiesterase [Chromatocurvus halotolerans]